MYVLYISTSYTTILRYFDYYCIFKTYAYLELTLTPAGPEMQELFLLQLPVLMMTMLLLLLLLLLLSSF